MTHILFLLVLLGWQDSVHSEEGLPTTITTTNPPPPPPPPPPTQMDYSSCVLRCDESYFPGRPCYCNAACDQYENCCFDYYNTCAPDFVWSDEWSVYGGHLYKYFEDGAVTGARAAAECREKGALLASLNDEEEADFIRNSVLRKRTLSAFIGATDIQEEGVWRWSDGSLVPLPTDTWHAWYDGQPDNSEGHEDCAIITNYKFWEIIKFMIDHYVWLDHSCALNNANEIQGYICEGSELCSPNPCLNGGQCRYIGSADETGSEITCLCVGNYVGDTCQYEMKEGEMWTLCGETNLTYQAGEVTSPLYPKPYPNNVLCAWNIRAEEQNTIALTVESFDVESGKNCVFDSMRIYNGGTENSSLLQGPSCGGLDDIMPVLASSGNEVLVVFRTDDSVRQKGFKLKYKQESCGMGAGSSGCGTHRTFTSECGSIEVKKGPDLAADADAACEWLIDVPQDKLINITFHQFNILDTGMSCTEGGLSIHDGPNGDSDLLGEYCGEHFPWSIVSSSNQLYLSFHLPYPPPQPHLYSWIHDTHIIRAEYTTINASDYSRMAADHVMEGSPVGALFLTSDSLFSIITGSHVIHRWLIRVPAGDKLHIDWTYSLLPGSTFHIYNGYSSESGSLLDAGGKEDEYGQTLKGSIKASAFQALVIFSALKDDSISYTMIQYKAIAWSPELSGCYRPHYFSSVHSPQTENSLVRPEQPLVLMVSEKSYQAKDAGYDDGLYCMWRIGSVAPGMLLTFLNVHISPSSDQCNYDGLIIYDGNSTAAPKKYGPFCGSVPPEDVTLAGDQALVVFYSDPRGGRRQGGIVRTLFSLPDPAGCSIYQMDHEEDGEVTSPGAGPAVVSYCGVILSPRLPGLVSPTLYYWLVSARDWHYYEIYLYYVRGPNIKQDCSQHFTLREVPHDSGKLQQIEANMLHLCGDTDLFIPYRPLRTPPHQKFAVELNVAALSSVQKWEFKLSYKAKAMDAPADTTPPVGLVCPEEYLYYRGYCYRYYPWVLRHYEDKYNYQTKWQTSQDHCRSEGATLLTIKDEQEAYFVKYTLAHSWLWDPSASFQANNRFIFLGLTNKQGGGVEYHWVDGTKASYADWYVPKHAWEPKAILEDSVGFDFIDLNKPQPTADVGSLCTGFFANDAFGSMNWVKIPCDYPLFRSGLICKKPIEGMVQPEINHSRMLQETYETGEIACPDGWLMILNRCMKLLTNYTLVQSASSSPINSAGSTPAPLALTYSEAASMCAQEEEYGHVIGGEGPISISGSGGGHVSGMTSQLFAALRHFLLLWRHDHSLGDIWTCSAPSNAECNIIKVIRDSYLDDTVQYEMRATPCDDDTIPIRNVLCEIEPQDVRERCGAHEFTCANKACVSVDHVCDGVNDCLDASDEYNCTCGEIDMYNCSNGRCVPINLRCNFRDDCGDNSDEHHCVLEMCGDDEFRCANGECVEINSTCDFVLDCQDGSDETENTCGGQCSGLTCFSGICIPISLQGDLISDCPGFSLEDELDTNQDMSTFFDVFRDDKSSNNGDGGGTPEDGQIQGNTSTPLQCEGRGDQVACRAGQPRCFSRSRSCVYDSILVDEARQLQVQAACRDGAHARNYCDLVECGAGMYHCAGGAYCVPYRKLCDRAMDCPSGDDEMSCGNFSCPGLYKCKGESFCIPHSEVCDGHVHCMKHRDDEMYCDDTEPLCHTSGCTCLGNSVWCEFASLQHIPRLEDSNVTRRARALFLSHNELHDLDQESFVRFHWLSRLLISHNGIQELPSHVFVDLVNLIELDLSNNAILHLRPETFAGLISLRKLDVSHNLLQDLQRSSLAELSQLQHLIMEENEMLKDIAEDTFEGLLSLRTLNTDAFKFCCIAGDVETCTPAGDEFSNCEDLMANYPLQISIWVLGLSAFFGNLFVIIWRSVKDRSKVSSFYIINLGVSDFLMGVYMLIIASVDAYYRGKYIIYADSWRASALCQVAGIVAMLASEVSVFMLTAITVDRAVSIMFPLKMRSFRLKHARIVAGCGWIISLFLSVLPASKTSYFGDAFFGRTGVCLPFQVSNEKLPGWEYSVFIFLVINLISFLVIFVGYVLIFMTVKSSMEAMGNKSTGAGADEYSLAKKLALIVATDFICWVPIILIGFAALGGSRIDPKVSAWIAVFILPLNSAVNPILYTMSAINCGKKKRRPSKSQRATATSYVSQTCTETMMTSTAHGTELRDKHPHLISTSSPDVTKRHVSTTDVSISLKVKGEEALTDNGDGHDNNGYV